LSVIPVSSKSSSRIANRSGRRFSVKHSSQVIVGSGVGSGVVSLTTTTLFSLSLLLIQTNLKPLSFCLYPFLSSYKPLAVVV